MVKTFSPKYKSKYNNLQEVSVVPKRAVSGNMSVDFVPKEVKISKRKAIQVSYKSRMEKQAIREYNG